MQFHELKPIHKKKSRKRIGRGGKKGDYSGKGIKGQNSRTGRKKQPFIRELTKRYHKLKGYRQGPRKKLEVSFNVSVLEDNFKAGEEVTLKALLNKGIISRIKGKVPAVKILGQGKLTKKLIIKGCQASKGAEEKIKKAKGTIL